MRLANQWKGSLAAVLTMIGISLGLAICGCAPPAQQEEPVIEEVVVEQGVVEQPAAEQPAETPAATEKAAETPASEPEAEPAAQSAPQPIGEGIDVPMSSFAPAEDLANQVPDYIEDLEEALASEEEFKDSGEKIGKTANSLAVIALGLGLHDQDNSYKAGAGAMIQACAEMAAASDYAAAQQALEAVKKAATGEATAEVELKWEKVASLPELMKQVPLVNTKLKRYVKGNRLKKKAKDSQGLSAVIAVIGQGSLANAGDTEKPDAVAEWHKYCIQMRNAAASVNVAIRAQDPEATKAAMAALAQSCDDCHTVFHQEALGKE